MWMVYWSLSFLEYTYKNDFSFSVIVFNWHSFSLLGCQILMASWSDSPPFPLLSVTSTVPFFVSLRLRVPFLLILEVAKLGSFHFPEQCSSMTLELGSWRWWWEEWSGSNQCPLSVLSLSPPVLEAESNWHPVHSQEMASPHSASFWFHLVLMDVLILIGGHAWFSWGSAQLHSDPPFPGGPLRGPALIRFCMGLWCLLLDKPPISKSPVPPLILMTLEKEPGELLRLDFALSKLHRELYVVALPYFLPCMVAPQALEALLHWLLQ